MTFREAYIVCILRNCYELCKPLWSKLGLKLATVHNLTFWRACTFQPQELYVLSSIWNQRLIPTGMPLGSLFFLIPSNTWIMHLSSRLSCILDEVQVHPTSSSNRSCAGTSYWIVGSPSFVARRSTGCPVQYSGQSNCSPVSWPPSQSLCTSLIFDC